jgi:heme/copper-type cytochrome/quinol oxidase subunit 2
MTESLMTYHACSSRDMTQDKKYKIKEMSVRKTRGGSRHLNWLVGFFLILILGTGFAAADEPKKFTLINVLLDGTKIWLPSSIIVQQGDAVELTLVNKLDDPHGFEIKAFGIEQVVQPKSEMTVKFTASKAGAYSYICQMHPPHLGGQILVLSK